MKRLTPLWFLKHPLDSEQKSYVLLDQLKKYQDDLKKDQISNTLREIFMIIKDLSNFKKEQNVSFETYTNLSPEELDLLDVYINMDTDLEEYQSLLEVLDTCLGILYKYANIGMGLLDERNNRIKTFEIVPLGVKEKNKFGFLFIRNMITDEIIPFYWSESFMENDKSSPCQGIALKKIITDDPVYYSLSYVNVAHGLIEETDKIDRRETPRILICEIDENFTEHSDVIKTAKENFMNKLNSEPNRRI